MRTLVAVLVAIGLVALAAGAGAAVFGFERGRRSVATKVTHESGFDKDLIAFGSDADGGFHIYVIAADGHSLRQVTRGTSDQFAPTWSPDREWIAFERQGEGSDSDVDSIYIAHPDGSDLHPVPLGADLGIFEVGKPAWSPDGNWIAFSAVRQMPNGDRIRQIMITSPNGSGTRAVTSPGSPNGDYAPAWSPDNGQIAFHRGTKTESDIFIVRLDGEVTRRITSGPAEVSNRNPAWAPDGTQIVFDANRDAADRDVYVMNTLGDNIRAVARGVGDDQYPDWAPDSRSVIYSADIGADTIASQLVVVALATGEKRVVVDPETDFGDEDIEVYYAAWAG